MEELRESTRAYLEGREYKNTVLPHPYAFNLFSHNSKIDPSNGYNEEEIKVMRETHKIYGDSSIRVAATCVRVPVLRAHSIAINFECERPITPAQVRDIIKTAPGVRFVDDVESGTTSPCPRTSPDRILFSSAAFARTSATRAGARLPCSSLATSF